MTAAPENDLPVAVWVATVDTYYRVTAVAESQDEAVRLAATGALRYLRGAGTESVDTDSVEKIIDWFGVTAQAIVIGAAALEGDR